MGTNTKYYLTVLTLYCVTATSAFLYQYNALKLTPKQFPAYVNPYQINIDFSRGFTTLANCSYFKRVYPKFYKELFKHTEVFFSYSDDSRMKNYYAVTVRSENTIYLGDNYFDVSDNNTREGIIGHEMLHIVGMPKHKKDYMDKMEDRHADAVYTVEHMCFHPEEVWGTVR